MSLQPDMRHLQCQPPLGIGHRGVVRFEGSLRHGERRLLAVDRLLCFAHAILRVHGSVMNSGQKIAPKQPNCIAIMSAACV